MGSKIFSMPNNDLFLISFKKFPRVFFENENGNLQI